MRERIQLLAQMRSWRVLLLRIPLPDVVSMQTRQANLEGADGTPLRRLVKEALRMRPSRLAVGEVRGSEGTVRAGDPCASSGR